MLKFLLNTTLILLLASCTTRPIHTTSNNAEWREKFLANKCENYTELSLAQNFPLHDLALLKAHQTCTDKKRLAPINSIEEKNRIIYQELFLQLKLQYAQEALNKKDEIETLIEIGKNQSFFKTREENFKQALQLAKETKNDELIKITTEQLENSSPRLKKPSRENISTKDLLLIAQDYRQWHEYKPAVKIYKQILKSNETTQDEKQITLKNLRMTYKNMQDKNSYITTTQKIYQNYRQIWLKNKKDQIAGKKLNEAISNLARTYWTEDQTNKAQTLITKSLRELNNLYSTQELLYIQARIAEEKKDYNKADQLYEKSLQQKNVTAELQNKILWARAWMNYKKQNYSLTTELLTQLEMNAADPSDKARAQFWKAKSLIKENKNSEAEVILRKIKSDDPIGYYGLISMRELNEKITPLIQKENATIDLQLTNIKSLPQDRTEVIEWLIQVNENKFVEKELNYLSGLLLKSGNHDQKDWLRIMSAYARAGLYLPLFSGLTTLPPEVKDQMVNENPSLLFPQPWKEFVITNSQKQKIPYELIYSIMRQESSFNPQARSAADAYGLLQMLPGTAKTIAEKNKINYKKAEDLFDPEINISVGAGELSQLYNKYHQQMILVAGGYNASSSALNGWLKNRFRNDSLEFIEDIPYEETRIYIKLIIRNFVFYRRINAQQPFPFPEKELLSLEKNLD